MRRLAPLVLLAVAGAAATAAGLDGIRVTKVTGKWESGYGVEFYNVVGTVAVTDDTARKWIKLRVEALDAAGTVVATEHAWNETAEALGAPGADAAALLASGKVTPVAPEATQRFRASFLKDEHPTIASHRVAVVEAPEVD
jgi:hypothetical protein